jgi:hypothetical protein
MLAETLNQPWGDLFSCTGQLLKLLLFIGTTSLTGQDRTNHFGKVTFPDGLELRFG